MNRYKKIPQKMLRNINPKRCISGMWSETSKLTFQRQVDAIDVKLKIAVGLSNLTFNYWDGEIKILDDKLETTKSFPIGAGISSIRWINDSVLLSSLDNGGISYISVEDDSKEGIIIAHETPVISLDYSSKSSKVLSVGSDAAIKLWSVSDNPALPLKLEKTFTKQLRRINQAKWDINGNLFCSVGEENKVKFWDIRQSKSTPSLTQNQNFFSRSLSWNPDNDKLLLTGRENGSVTLIDLRSIEKPIAEFENVHSDSVSTIAWSTKHITSGGNDGKTKIWNIVDDKIEAKFSSEASTGYIRSVFNYENEARVLSGNWGNTVNEFRFK